jgi:PAS domain S-box-containing protein
VIEEIVQQVNIFSFLQDGGEMGQLTREYNWAETPIRGPENWPQSLRTSVSIVLNAKFPMLLLWGDDLIQFYNDDFRPSLGMNGKHPTALGQSAEECWNEIWDTIKPLFDKVLSGEAIWREDQLIPIFRNGKMEDVYWTFGYSPVRGEAGNVEGILVVCHETTEKINQFNALLEGRDLLHFAVEATELGTWELDPVSGKLSSNNRLKEWYGLLPDQPMDLHSFLHIIAEPDREKVRLAINNALQYASGGYYDTSYSIIHPVSYEERIVRAKGRAWFNENKQAYRFDGTVQDISNEISVQKELSENRQTLELAIEIGELGIFKIDPDSEKVSISQQVMDWFGFPEQQCTFSNIMERIVDADKQAFEKAIRDSLTKKSNGRHEMVFRMIRPQDGKLFYLKSIGQVERKDNTSVCINGIIQDVTNQVTTTIEIEERERKFRNIVHQCPVGITMFRGRNFVVEMANETYLEIVDRKEQELVGRPFFDSLPEVKDMVNDLLLGVYTTGIPYYGTEFPVPLNRHGKKEITYFNFVYQALREDNGEISGIVVVANEVTKLVKGKHALSESEKEFRKLFTQSPIAMAIIRGRDHVIEQANKVMFDNIWKKKEEEVIGKTILEVFPELSDQKYPSLLDHVFQSGEAHKEIESLAYIMYPEGRGKLYLDFEYSPLFEADNSVSGIMITVNDVTERVESRKKIEEAEERARLAIDSADLGTYEINLFTNEMITTPRFDAIWGVEHNLERKEYASFIHPDDMPTRKKAHDISLETGNLRYEARVIWKDSSVHWVRVKGKVLFDNNGTATTLLGVIQDITEQKRFAEELSLQVKERTEELEHKNLELERSNANLQEFAYAASHDLKEPIRKIHYFSDRLKNTYGNALNAEGARMLERLGVATDRMQTLVDDLLEYSQVSRGAVLLDTINLNDNISLVLNDLEMEISQKKAHITVGQLPVIKGHSRQTQQLFQNLIGNALKYSHPDIAPEISITSEIMEGNEAGLPSNARSFNGPFHLIEIRDNGIGFEQKDAERIFQVFTRLHGNTEYKGTGVGLSIAQKVVQNHNGFIYAKSKPGEGSSFYLALPKF